MSLKGELVKLGSQHPDLQTHLKPVLDHLERSRTSSRSKMSALRDKIDAWIQRVLRAIDDDIQSTFDGLDAENVRGKTRKWKSPNGSVLSYTVGVRGSDEDKYNLVTEVNLFLEDPAGRMESQDMTFKERRTQPDDIAGFVSGWYQDRM